MSTCNCTMGFSGPGDISINSVLSSHLCEVGYGVQLTAQLHNLGCPSAESGTVTFYWVPIGWSGNTQPVPTPDSQSGSNTAPALGPGNSVPPGQAYPATVCWVPSAAEIGQGNPVKGNILAVATSGGNAQCPPCAPTSFQSPPCTQLSGPFSIFDPSEGVFPAPPPPPPPCIGPHPVTGAPASFLYLAFVVPNPRKEAGNVRIVARGVRLPPGGRDLPPIGPSKQEPRTVVGASRIADVVARVGLGRPRRSASDGGFMAAFRTGILDPAMVGSMLDEAGLQERREVVLETGEVRQGILEVAFPDPGSAPTSCVVQVSYLSDREHGLGGFSIALGSDGVIL